MIDRFWDKKGQYTGGVLKKYKYWVLEVSYRQHTLGCFIIFAKRDVEKISQLKAKELIQLKEVMLEIEKALLNSDVFAPDRFNYLQLGNNLHHLHFHGIPRYKKSREFAGTKWVDTAWGSPPIWSNKDIDADLVRKIREVIESDLVS